MLEQTQKQISDVCLDSSFLGLVRELDRDGQENHRGRARLSGELYSGAHYGQQAVRREFGDVALRALRLDLLVDVCVLLRRDPFGDYLAPKPAHRQPIRQGIHDEAEGRVCVRAPHHGDGAIWGAGVMIRPVAK